MTNTSDDQTLTIPDAVESEVQVTEEVPAAAGEEVHEEPAGEATEATEESYGEVADEASEENAEQGEQSEEAPKQDASERALRLITAIERDVRELRALITGNSVAYGVKPGSAPKMTAFTADENVATPSGFMTRSQSRGDEGIEGTFDGERMIDTNGKTYPVPPNYASKSKLVEGDPLKLYIAPDGKFVFKQLGPIQRKSYMGTLIQDGTHYIVNTDEGVTYNILTACVTYHMALYGLMPGGRVQILVPADRETRWAVIDAVI